jgi:hypothetical protein
MRASVRATMALSCRAGSCRAGVVPGHGRDAEVAPFSASPRPNHGIFALRINIWNQRHLLHALREFEQFYNSHRPHQGITNARPLRPLPPQIADPDKIARLDIRRRDRLGGILHEYEHAA